MARLVSSAFTRGTSAFRERVAPEYHVEGEGPSRLGEEPLGARLAAEAATEHVRKEVRRRERAGHALALEEGCTDRLRAVLEERREDVPGTHEGHRAGTEITDFRR